MNLTDAAASLAETQLRDLLDQAGIDPAKGAPAVDQFIVHAPAWERSLHRSGGADWPLEWLGIGFHLGAWGPSEITHRPGIPSLSAVITGYAMQRHWPG